jgi:hypothetical protein
LAGLTQSRLEEMESNFAKIADETDNIYVPWESI